MTSIVCKNCKYKFDGKFCNNCGQSAQTQQINLGYLVEAVSNSVFQIERGFLFTLKELFVAPGKTIRGFLEGKRQPYVKPLAYLLFTSALYVLFAHFLDLNTYSKDVVEGFTSAMDDGERTEALEILSVLNWLSKNHAVTVLLILPLFSLGSYLAFKKSGFNYSEHLVLNTYVAAQQMIIYMVFGFFVTKGGVSEVLPLAIGVLFNFYVFYQFFDSRNSVLRVLLFLLTYVIFVFQLVGVLFLVVGFVEVVVR